MLAHPLKYRMTSTKLRRCLKDFVAAGGVGIEAWSGRQTEEQTRYLCRLAADFGLPVSAGSDFHAPGEYAPRLGFDSTRLPDEVEVITAERLQ